LKTYLRSILIFDFIWKFSYKDVRSLISDELDLNVYSVNDAQYAWYGGQMLANSVDNASLVVKKASYEEHGHNICKQKFDYLGS
jgi:actin-related protein